MQRSVTHSTFVIERVYPVAPERVFAALSNPEAKRRWHSDFNSRETLEFQSDFRVGGAEHALYRMGQSTPLPGAELLNRAVYLEIVPGERIVTAYTMALNSRIFSASLATFQLAPAEAGTLLTFTEQGAFFEGSDGPQMREAGWRKLLDAVAAELAH